MLEAVLRLSFCRGIGPRLGKELLARFPDPAAIFAASPEALALPERAVAGLSDPHAAEAARREIREARRRGFSLRGCPTATFVSSRSRNRLGCCSISSRIACCAASTRRGVTPTVP